MYFLRFRIINLLVYFLFILAYPILLDLFNYMWKVEPCINYYKLFGYSFLLLFFSNVKFRYLPILTFLLIPVISLDTYTNELGNYILLFCSIIWTFVMHYNFKFNLKILKVKLSSVATYFLMILSISLIFYFFKNIQTFNPILLLTDVYTFRRDNIFIGIEGYLVSWLPTVILPFLIFCSRKYKICQFITAILVSYLVFLITGVKSWLFLSFILLVPYYFSQKSILSNFPIVILILLTSLFIFSNAFYLAFMDRILYVTPLYTLRYISFFNSHDLMFFEDSKLGIFSPFGDKYNQSVGLLIDSEFGGKGMNANVGIIGTAYSDLGIVGLIILTTIVIIFIGNFFVNKGSWALSLYLMYVYLSSNSPPLDLILTHGLLINVFLLFLFKSELQSDDFNIYRYFIKKINPNDEQL